MRWKTIFTLLIFTLSIFLNIFRKTGEMDNFVGLSFDTISSVGPNGAIIHYKPSQESNRWNIFQTVVCRNFNTYFFIFFRLLTTEELYLVDSGGQYKDGTTDVTRTLHFGSPKPFEKECFTRVLKGQLKVAMAVFPSKIKGNYLDTLARISLWEVGLDYSHGKYFFILSRINSVCHFLHALFAQCTPIIAF